MARRTLLTHFSRTRVSHARAALAGAYPLHLREALRTMQDEPRWLAQPTIKDIVTRIAKHYPEPDTRRFAQEVLDGD